MKLRSIIPLLLIFTIFLAGCEEDDICIGDGTPNLTVVFRNAFNSENQKDTLSIYRSFSPGFENPDTIYQKVFTDSIKLPLGGLSSDKAYFKIRRASNPDADVLSVGYTVNSEFVSKACGFKMVYSNLNYTATNFHINSIEPIESNELRDEKLTNLYIILSD